MRACSPDHRLLAALLDASTGAPARAALATPITRASAPPATRPPAPVVAPIAAGPSVLGLLGAPPPPRAAQPPSVTPALGQKIAPAPPQALSARPPAAPSRPPSAPPPPAAAPSPAAAMAADLERRGFPLLRRGDRLFVARASALPEEDRERIKNHRAELLPFAQRMPDEIEVQPMQAMMAPPARQDRGWVAQAPRPLDGISDIVLNFETTGLKWAQGDHPIGVTVGTLDGAFQQYLPWGHTGGNLPREQVIEFLRREVRGKRIHNINMAFDLHMGRVAGVDFEGQGNRVTDIAHTAALLDDHRKRFALDVLAADFLGGAKIPRLDESRMADYHAADVAARAEYQAVLVAQLHAKMDPMIDAQDLRAVQDLEDKVIYPVVEMEKNGAPIDMELLHAYSKEFQTWHENLLWEVSREVGFAFDHTPAAWRRLFERFNLPIAHLESRDREGKRKETYADGVLAKIDHPTVAKARLAGQLASLNSKIMKPYLEMIGSDGILRFQINQLRGDEGGTVSGRFSIGYVQQVPNADNHAATFGDRLNPRRLYVVAPGSGARYFAADAAQIEFRIFSSFANNPRVMAAYAADPRTNFHKFIWPLLREFRADLSYTGTKGLNFATIYGAGLPKTGVMMNMLTEEMADEIRKFGNQKTDPRLDPVRDVKAIYNRELPEVEPLLRKASHLAQSKCDEFCGKSRISRELHAEGLPHRGFVKTIKGRRARFPNGFGLHKALNRVIQGTAADIMKQKLVEVHNARKDTGFVMRMTVHDELCGDSPDPECDRRVMEILNQQSFSGLRVPILWESDAGASWADAK